MVKKPANPNAKGKGKGKGDRRCGEPAEASTNDSGSIAKAFVQTRHTRATTERLKRQVSVAWVGRRARAARNRKKVCILYDEKMLQHCAIGYETPSRISCIMKKLADEGLLKRCFLKKPDPVGDEQLLAVHDEGYHQFIKDLPLETKKKKKSYKKFYDQDDISFSNGTLDAILLSAGSVVKGCDLVATGKCDHAFAVVRPPGHHATKNKASGFCFLNNVAIGALHMLNAHRFKKVLIVDFDVHHGDGTQDIFLDDDRVLVFSSHRGDIFPSDSSKSGKIIGSGRGQGFNINVSLRGAFGDDDLLAVFHHVLLPVANAFEPDVILVSAGFDAAEGDPLGRCKVSPHCFGTIIDMLLALPSKGLVLTLEGGYNLGALTESASSCVKALLGDKDGILTLENVSPKPSTWETIVKVRRYLSPYWPVLESAIPMLDSDSGVPAKSGDEGENHDPD